MSLFRPSLAVAALMALAAPALADDLEFVEQYEGWTLYVDNSVGFGCLVHAAYDDGTEFRIGFRDQGESAFLWAVSPEWQVFRPGADYDLNVVMNNLTSVGTGTGLDHDGVPGVEVHFDDEDFILELTAGGLLELYIEDNAIFGLDLSGATEALDAALMCYSALD